MIGNGFTCAACNGTLYPKVEELANGMRCTHCNARVEFDDYVNIPLTALRDLIKDVERLRHRCKTLTDLADGFNKRLNEVERRTRTPGEKIKIAVRKWNFRRRGY